jgi:hypothetical protein
MNKEGIDHIRVEYSVIFTKKIPSESLFSPLRSEKEHNANPSQNRRGMACISPMLKAIGM